MISGRSSYRGQGCFFLISIAAQLREAFLIRTQGMLRVGGLLIKLMPGFMLFLKFIELINTGKNQ